MLYFIINRFDAHERPELSRGSVEWAATPEYMLRPPMVSSHFFLIDVSQVWEG
jgi:protein transport protein SEC24